MKIDKEGFKNTATFWVNMRLNYEKIFSYDITFNSDCLCMNVRKWYQIAQ